MSENCSKDENERIKMEDQTISKNIYFSNQTISNACGTMAIHHALLNNTKLVDIGFKRRWYLKDMKKLKIFPPWKK
jgi:ubiquitin carboxyl-terminal hydrolase L3